MGNEISSGSVDGMAGALPLQCQGVEHLWSLELNRGKGGEGEGVCVFSRTFGNGTQDDLCRAGLEVSGVIWKKKMAKDEDTMLIVIMRCVFSCSICDSCVIPTLSSS